MLHHRNGCFACFIRNPWKFDREAMHDGRRNVYSFEMNGKKHNLHLFKGNQEETNNQMPMMTDKKMVTDWKVEENDNEVELSNMVCSGWMKDKTNQQDISYGSMALMDEPHYEVMNNNRKCMVTKMIKDSDVKVISRREEG